MLGSSLSLALGAWGQRPVGCGFVCMCAESACTRRRVPAASHARRLCVAPSGLLKPRTPPTPLRSRRQGRDKLSFSCRCSMLEIYNEVITDLLNPSATNLQVRAGAVRCVWCVCMCPHRFAQLARMSPLPGCDQACTPPQALAALRQPHRRQAPILGPPGLHRRSVRT